MYILGLDILCLRRETDLKKNRNRNLLYSQCRLEDSTLCTSSYRVGGTRAFLKMRSYQTQFNNYIPSDGNNLMEIYMYFILWKLFMVSSGGIKSSFICW